MFNQSKFLGSLHQSDTLFIFGTMLKQNDDHIKEAIVKGKFSDCYLGVYNDEDLVDAERFKEEFEMSNKVKIKDIEAAQRKMLDVAQKMIEDGIIDRENN